MKITSALCRMLYAHLHSTVLVPLKIDVVPEWCVEFDLIKDENVYGWINPEDSDDDPFRTYQMEISTVKNKNYKDLTETMLHEMLHIALEYKGDKKWDEHGPGTPFQKLKTKVETYTGLEIS